MSNLASKFGTESAIFRVFLAILCFLLPVFLALFLGSPLLMLQNFTDGVFYLGYALQFHELVARVGLIYYAVRFGGILPDALAFSILGPDIGLPLVRYGLAGLCCLVLFLLFSARGARVWGVFAAFMWAVNPAAIRLLQTAYVDVAGTYFMLLGMLLLLFPTVRNWMAFLAGVFLLLAISAHLHAAIALFFALPLIILVRLQEGWKPMFIQGLWATIAAVLVAGTAAVFYFLNFGLWDWTSPTLEHFQQLRDGDAAIWRRSWSEVLQIGPFWLLPIPAMVIYCMVRSKDRLLLGSFLGLVGYIGFLFYGDFFHGGFSLSMFYYFSFVLPCLTLFLAATGQAISAGSNQFRWHETFVSAVLGLAFLLPVFLERWSAGHLSALWVSVVLFVCLLGLGFWRKPFIMFWIYPVLFFIMSWLVAKAPTSSLALGRYWKSDDIGVLGVGRQLGEILPKAREDAGILKFWFDDPGEGDLRMVQSLYLHNFTRLQREDWSAVSYSELTPEDARLIRSSGVRHLVLLGLKPEEITTGVNYLKNAGIDFEEWNRIKLTDRDENLEVLHLFLPQPEVVEQQSLSLSEIRLQNGATLTRTQTGWRIQSEAIKWHVDAYLPIPEFKPGQGVRVIFRVEKGAVDFGFLSEAGAGVMQSNQRYSITPGIVETIIWPRKPELAKYLFVRNVHARPVRSMMTLIEVQIVEEVSLLDEVEYLVPES